MAIIDFYKQGQFIDQYEVLKLLSVTQNSHVYLVQAKHVHKPQVLKLHSAKLGDKQCKHFIEQANMLLEFSSHANIVDVLHVGSLPTSWDNSDNARPFLLMPYYPQTLHDLLALHNQRLSFITSLAIINCLVDALHTIHNAGIVHLDIKPQNVFLDEHNNALLADFDNALVTSTSPLAKRFGLSSNAMQSSAMPIPKGGSREYASPEQLRLLKGVSKKNLLKSNTTDDNKHTDASDGYFDKTLIDTASINAPSSTTPYKNAAPCANGMLGITTNSDMYSLGVLWYRMLIGAVPSKDITSSSNISALTPRLQQATPVLDESQIKQNLQNVAPDWGIDLILGLLKQNSHDRFNTSDLKSSIIKNMRAPEINETLDASAFSDDIDADNECNTSDSIHVATGKETNVSVSTFGHSSRYIFSLLAIISVLLYWLIMPAPSNNEITTHENSVVRKNAERGSEKIVNVNSSNTFPEGPLQKHTLTEQHLHDTQNTQDLTVLLKRAQTAPPDIIEQGVNNKVIDAVDLKQSYTMLIEKRNTHGSLRIDWITLTALPNVQVMSTEVTNALFALCVQEGGCDQHTLVPFSGVRNTALIDLPGHPKVNVSWYEITQQFIPWLSEKTKKRFSLPTKAQWLAINAPTNAPTHSSRSLNKSSTFAVHCKNCNHSLARQYAGVTMPVKAINPDHNNLFHILGNAQEWLQNCWEQTSADNIIVERCDQAIVAGGSWLSKQDEATSQSFTQLLKGAKTPTTGFRLVALIDE